MLKTLTLALVLLLAPVMCRSDVQTWTVEGTHMSFEFDGTNLRTVGSPMTVGGEW